MPCLYKYLNGIICLGRRTSPQPPLQKRGEKKEDEYSPLFRRGVGGEVLRALRHKVYNSVFKSIIAILLLIKIHSTRGQFLQSSLDC